MTLTSSPHYFLFIITYYFQQILSHSLWSLTTPMLVLTFFFFFFSLVNLFLAANVNEILALPSPVYDTPVRS